MREAEAEGIEMVMWLIMCGALDDKAEEIYRFYAVPTSNTPSGTSYLRTGRVAFSLQHRSGSKCAKVAGRCP
jgi:hypothetical protein